MNTTIFRRAIVPTVAALTLGLGLTACGPSNEEGGSGSGSAPKVDGLSGSFKIGGSSAQEKAQAAWKAGFQSANPDVNISYDPVGSGGGRENFISGGFPLAGSDSYLVDDEEGKELSDAKKQCGGSVIEVPNYVSPISVIFNIKGVDKLQLSPQTLASIFAGKIKTWDDEAIKKDNPDADLPSTQITPVHRAEESGTTENFTDYLDAVAKKEWGFGVVEIWPGKAGGSSAKETSGMVQSVTQTDGAIGYADASAAGDLGQASIKVGEDFVEPSAEAAAKIFESSKQVKGRDKTDLVYDINHETTDKGVYPIVMTSYLLACPTYKKKEDAEFAKAYASYVLSEDGQKDAEKNAGSAPLSSTVSEKAVEIVKQIKAG